MSCFPKNVESILQAWYIIPRPITGAVSSGGLSGKIALLRARASSWVRQGGCLLPAWIRRIHFAKLALHPHLQKLWTRMSVKRKIPGSLGKISYINGLNICLLPTVKMVNSNCSQQSNMS